MKKQEAKQTIIRKAIDYNISLTEKNFKFASYTYGILSYEYRDQNSGLLHEISIEPSGTLLANESISTLLNSKFDYICYKAYENQTFTLEWKKQ